MRDAAETPRGGEVTAESVDEIRRAVQQALSDVAEREREEKAREKEKAGQKERLTSRVSVAAICLTMLMSFLGFARAERGSASGGAAADGARAKSDAEADWAYYQTRMAERSGYVVAEDTLARETATLPDDDPRVQLAAVHYAEYVARRTSIDQSNRQLFFVVQDLERQVVDDTRRAARIDRTIARYDMGTRILTLAVVLLSVTLLANRAYLFWVAAAVAVVGAAFAINGYFLLF